MASLVKKAQRSLIERQKIEERAAQQAQAKRDKLKASYVKQIKSASSGGMGYSPQQIEQMRQAAHVQLESQFDTARDRLREVAARRGVIGSSAMLMLDSRMQGDLAGQKAMASQNINQASIRKSFAAAKAGLASMASLGMNEERAELQMKLSAKERKAQRDQLSKTGMYSFFAALGAGGGALAASQGGEQNDNWLGPISNPYYTNEAPLNKGYDTGGTFFGDE